MVQAPAPERMIENGILAEALVAHVLIAIRRPHATLWPSANLCAPITLDRSTLADWIRRAAFTLRPVHTRLLELLKRSTNLFADETTTPVLDPGRRQERAALGVCVTSGLGPATLRQALPTSMRPTASMRGRPSISQDSARHLAGRWLRRLCGTRSTR